MTRPRAIWLGDCQHDEFRPGREALARCFQLADAPDLPAAERLLRAGFVPLLALAELRRGVWARSELERLHAASPLTRLLLVHGSWCEGSPRTGNFWPGLEHLYWHQLPARAPQLCRQPPPARTLSEQERWLAGLPHVNAEAAAGGSAWIDAQPAQRQALADALHALRVPAAEDPARAAVALWDGDPRRALDWDRLLALQKSAPQARRIALVTAPRAADWQQLAPLCDGILSKPFLLADLQWQIEACNKAAANA